jgi:transposase
LSVSKLKIWVAVAEGGRRGEVRFFGDIDSSPAALAAPTKNFAKPGTRLTFCYEAGPTGDELHRQIIAAGHDSVVAPSLTPKRPGDRVKPNRRGAVNLAKLHRAGELTPVWAPDRGHEAMGDLVRAREAAMDALRRARQQLQSFLLRHGRCYSGRQAWSKAHSGWLCDQKSNTATPSRKPRSGWTA